MKPNSLIMRAATFASKCHKGQFRKDGITPYISHPGYVAALLFQRNFSEEVVAAAWLHDVIEDCNIRHEQLESTFGAKVANLVQEVTNPSMSHPKHNNREERKKTDREYLAKVSLEAKAIKLADRYHNILNCPEGKFRDLYFNETRELLPCIANGSPELAEMCYSVLNKDTKNDV